MGLTIMKMQHHLLVPALLCVLTAVAAGPLPSVTPTYYYFDVMSDAPTADVKGSLDGFNTLLAFKVEGVGRYLFIVENDGTGKVDLVQFPPKAKVVINRVYTTKDYLQRFGDIAGWEDPASLEDNKNLVLLKWDIDVPAGTTAAGFTDHMKRFGDLYSGGFAGHKAYSFTSGGVYPVKILSFTNLKDSESDQVVAEAVKGLGGPYVGRVYIRHLIRI